MHEIVLPIKCSTVKKLNDRCAFLLLVMVYAYAGACIPSLYYYSTHSMYVYGFIYDFAFICVTAVCLFIAIMTTVLLLERIYEELPALSCIKDEVEL